MTRVLLVLPFTLLLAACGSDDATLSSALVSASYDQTPTGAIGSRIPEQTLPSTAALIALPPSAGMATEVRERDYANGAFQRMIMDGPSPHGPNVVEIAVMTSADRVRRDLSVPMSKPTEAGIRAEIRARFPDVRMQIVGKPMENALGPFGLAIGGFTDGTRCIFAWQWVDDFRDAGHSETGFGRLASAWSHKAGMPASIRVRLCRPDITVDEMASDMRGLTLGDPTNIDRIREARNIVQPTGGGSGPTVIGAGLGGDGTLESQIDAELTPARGKPAPGFVAARPAPARRHVARKAAAHATTVAARVKREKPQPKNEDEGTITPYSGPYLAPVGAAQSPAPRGLSAPAYHSSALDPSLPPQAFRGPTGSYSMDAANAQSPYSR